jgi:cell division protein FtsZ
LASLTRPFTFEGSKRLQGAEQGIRPLKEQADTLIVIPMIASCRSWTASPACRILIKTADDVLRQGIQGISELITIPVDQPRLCRRATIMSVGWSRPHGRRQRHRRRPRAEKAAEQADLKANCWISPLSAARGILINITGVPA